MTLAAMAEEYPLTYFIGAKGVPSIIQSPGSTPMVTLIKAYLVQKQNFNLHLSRSTPLIISCNTRGKLVYGATSAAAKVTAIGADAARPARS
jgi:hypothetical protein